MPFTKCSECNKDISSQATICPHCGYPLTAAQDKVLPSSPANPQTIQSQEHVPPVDPAAPTNPTKKMSQAKLGCLGFLIILGLFILITIIGTFILGSSQDNIPKSIKITSGQVVFGSWNDLNDFNNAAMQIASADANAYLKDHPNGQTDDDAKAFTNQDERNLESLRAKFESENRILKVPIGTKIKIEKFYDKTGSEITPVWNEPQKTVYTSDGHFVYPSGEWEGKTVYILKLFSSDSDGW